MKYPVLLSDFNEALNVINRVSKNIQILNFMKILLVLAESFHWYGQRDGNDKLNCRFSQFCKSAQNKLRNPQDGMLCSVLACRPHEEDEEEEKEKEICT
jgi:hypothetical protein